MTTETWLVSVVFLVVKRSKWRAQAGGGVTVDFGIKVRKSWSKVGQMSVQPAFDYYY